MSTTIDYRHNRPERERAMQRVSWITTGVDFLLAVLKLVVGWLVRSPALIADGLHSFSDLLSDFFVLAINKISHAEPDDEHPYGHARFETLGTVIIGLLLIAVAIGILWDNANRLINGNAVSSPSLMAIIVAAFSIVAKEGLYYYGKFWAKKLDSALLAANAWHSRTDSLTSLVVLGGVIATWLGYGWIEAWSALFIGLLIGKMGITLAWEALHDLADRSIGEEVHQQIRREIRAVPGVENVHELRSRRMGDHVFIDVHIQVDNFISVSEGHQIGDAVMLRLKEKVPELSDITLHVDPEDDTLMMPTELAPLRPEIEAALVAYPELTQFQNMHIHYQNQKVLLEFECLEPPSEAQLAQREQALTDLPWLARMSFVVRYETASNGSTAQ
jgi:cation diffusion facilitator family transporter